MTTSPRPPLTGKTRLVGVIGWPIEHSVSPPMHNAAFEALGLDWCYVPFAVAPERVAEALSGVRALGLRGINATVPHKQALLSLVDELTPAAQAIMPADRQSELMDLLHNALTLDLLKSGSRRNAASQDDCRAARQGACNQQAAGTCRCRVSEPPYPQQKDQQHRHIDGQVERVSHVAHLASGRTGASGRSRRIRRPG